jgi:hypothetical protein
MEFSPTSAIAETLTRATAMHRQQPRTQLAGNLLACPRIPQRAARNLAAALPP